jgi:TonB family protein
MKTAGAPLLTDSSTNSHFKLTIIDSRILPARLAAELARVAGELRRNLPELQRDPIGLGRHCAATLLETFSRSLSDPNLLAGFTSAAFIVASLVTFVVIFDRSAKYETLYEGPEEISIGDAVMLNLSKAEGLTGGGIDNKAVGRVGLRRESGEGSGPTPKRSQGGGSGGMEDETPPQRGAVPPPSSIPAPIPKHPPVNSPALPAAGIDIDPLLWTEVKYPLYGDPRSKSEIPSNGPGQNGGMGTNTGLGVGDGRGNGFGKGTDGNIGDGPRQQGCCGVGGAPDRDSYGSDRVLRSSEVEQRVRLVSKPEPHYSEEARRNQISGTVVLRVVFTRAGEVAQIRSVSTLPFGLTERAIAAARLIKFIPAMKGGHPVSVHMQLEYNFNLY